MRLLKESLSSINPFSFLKLFLGKRYPKALKWLVTVNTLQCCGEGRTSGDLQVIWTKFNLGWTSDAYANFLSFWGLVVAVSGTFLAPALLKSLSPFGFTSLANLAVFAGFSFRASQSPRALGQSGCPGLMSGA